MIAIGMFSAKQQKQLRDAIGNSDPKDRIEVRKFDAGYVLDFKPVKGNRLPFRPKAVPCLDFPELLETVKDAKKFLT